MDAVYSPHDGTSVRGDAGRRSVVPAIRRRDGYPPVPQRGAFKEDSDLLVDAEGRGSND